MFKKKMGNFVPESTGTRKYICVMCGMLRRLRV